jgi:hypothetical protein
MEDSTGQERKLSPDSESIMLHEEEHAIHRLLGSVLLAPNKYPRTRKVRVPEYSQVLASARELREQVADNRARTEIFAYRAQGETREGIEQKLLELGGLYDYLTSEKIDEIMRSLYARHPSSDDAIAAELKTAMAEYPVVVHDALDAISELEKFYPHDELTGLLINEPLSRWPKAARRLIESKLAREA